MLENLNKYRVVLASNSPRRRELLGNLGVNFTTRTLDGIDESYPQNLSYQDTACYIAHKKAVAYQASMAEDELIITADTIVCIDGRILGKPVDRDDACQMLRTLSGRTHQVVTGVAILSAENLRTFAVTTAVSVAPLTNELIEHYVSNYRPYDKAGAYGIQEWIGYVGVEAIDGSFFNVMGLPVQRLFKELSLIN